MIRKINLEDHAQLETVFPVVVQLRNHLTLETFKILITRLRNSNYELWAISEGTDFVGVIGMREYTDLVRGTHLYVDDLVVRDEHRSKKIGARLLRFAEEQAAQRGLESLRLACALVNEGGIRFYDREGWTRRSYGYVKKSPISNPVS